MIINCQEIYSQFLHKITEYDFLNMDTSDIYENLDSFLRTSISQPYILRVFNNISYKQELMEIDVELRNYIYENDSEIDKNFIINLLSKAMVVAWLEPKVNSGVNIAQMFTGKEQKFYSQATHLAEISKLLETNKSEIRKLIRDHSYINNQYLRRSTE